MTDSSESEDFTPPTAEQSEAIGKECVRAAAGCLPEELPKDEYEATRVILEAFAAAHKRYRECVKESGRVYFDVDLAGAVAAALFWHSASDSIDVDEVVCGCIGATPYLAFARAVALTESLDHAGSLAQDFCDMELGGGREAIAAALKLLAKAPT